MVATGWSDSFHTGPRRKCPESEVDALWLSKTCTVIHSVVEEIQEETDRLPEVLEPTQVYLGCLLCV